MITLEQLQRAYRGKRIVHITDKLHFPRDLVTLPDGTEVALDTMLHMTFLKDEIASEYFDMKIIDKLGELPLFKDPAIKLIVIANPREANSRIHGFLSEHESERSTTYTFLAGGK